MNNQIIAKITKAITHAFKSDGTAPGLTVAWLTHNQSFYVSVIRWIEGEKTVVCSAQHADLKTALFEVAGKFLAAHPPVKSPVEELAEMVSKPNAQEVTVLRMTHVNPIDVGLEFPEYHNDI
jgi:hypothetical protein